MIGDRRDYTLITGATLFQALLGFIYSVVIRRYISPDEYGVYQTANLVGIYLSYAQLGVLNSYSRDYPQYLGEGNQVAADRVRGVALLYLLMLYTLATIITVSVVWILLVGGHLDQTLGISVAIVSLVAQLSALTILASLTIRSEGRFTLSAAVVVISVTAQVVVGILSTRNFGYWGMFAGLLSAPFAALAASRMAFPRTQLQFDPGYVLKLIQSGMPLLIAGLVWTVIRTIDQFAIVTFFSAADLGIYSIAMTAFGALAVVPQALAGVMYVKMSATFGRAKSVPHLLAQTTSQSRVLAAVSTFASVIAYFAFPPLVRAVMPEYVEGIPAGQITIVGVTFYSTTILYGNVFTILRMNVELLKATGLLCTLSICMTLIAATLPGRSLERIAMASSISYFLYSWILIRRVGTLQGRSRATKMTWAAWGPILCGLAPSIVIYHSVPSMFSGFLMAIFIAGASSLYFLTRGAAIND